MEDEASIKPSAKKIREDKEVKKERQLYRNIEEFLIIKHKVNRKFVGSFDKHPRNIYLFGGTRIPDVYGWDDDGWDDDEDILYLAEGKLNFSGSNFDICLGQGVSCQRIADYVYLFFKKNSFDDLMQEAQEEIKEECKLWGLGLLLVDSTKEMEDSVQEVIKSEQSKRMNKNLKKHAIELLNNFFPTFNNSPYIEDEFKNFKLAITSGKNLLKYIREHSSNNLVSGVGWKVKTKMVREYDADYEEEEKDEEEKDEKDFFKWYYQADLGKTIDYYLNFYPYGYGSRSNLPLLSLKFDPHVTKWNKQINDNKKLESKITKIFGKLIPSGEREKTIISLWSWSKGKSSWKQEGEDVELAQDSIPEIARLIVKKRLTPVITTTFNILGENKDGIAKEVDKKYITLLNFFKIFYSF